jgi:voltage-gated potassium channel
LKSYLKNLVEINDNKESKIFDIFIQILIIFSIVAFSIETIPNLEKDTVLYLRNFEIFSITIFTLEYIIRVYTVNKKLSYIFSFYVSSFTTLWLPSLKSIKAIA